MGTQQMLLIILCVILIGVALAVGLSLFSANSVESNKSAITHDILNIFAASAYQHFLRPGSMGGGGYSFDGTGVPGAVAYSIPIQLSSNENGTYHAVNTATTCTITGTSTSFDGQVSATVGNDGRVTNWQFLGTDFQ
jgi:hypothetical protein